MTKLRKLPMALGVFFASMLAFAGVAAADPADPVGDAFSTAQSDIVGLVTDNAIPLIIAVLLVGIGVSLLVKYVRKGVRAA